jgi:hypothetical protein
VDQKEKLEVQGKELQERLDYAQKGIREIKAAVGTRLKI